MLIFFISFRSLKNIQDSSLFPSFFLIEVQPTHSVALVPGVQRSDSTTLYSTVTFDLHFLVQLFCSSTFNNSSPMELCSRFCAGVLHKQNLV